MRMLRSLSPRSRLLLGVAAAAVVLAGCFSGIPSGIDPPPGASPLRYRDQVFADITTTSNLVYGSAPDRNGNPVALKLDMYEPAGDTVTARPVVIWVHGGSFCCGDKTSGPSAIMAQWYAHLGYVAVSINYRLLAPGGCTGSGGVTQECYDAAIDATHDAQAAVRWLRANAATYDLDPNRIGIGGESAGAIVSVGVGILSDQPGSSGNPGYSSKVGGWVSISGGVPGGIFVTADDAPGYLFAGTADNVVPYQWSVDTATKMQEVGVSVYLRTLQGAGHVPWGQYEGLFKSQSSAFFYRYLDLAHAAR